MKKILTVLIALTLQGCMTFSQTGRDPLFKRLENMSEVAGCYSNLAQQINPEAINTYLSTTVWPSLDYVTHEKIQTIDVDITGVNSIGVRAYSDGNILKKSEFYRGEDFHYSSGAFTVASGIGASANGFFIGAAETTVRLGLDQSGNGQVTDSTIFVGALVFALPVGGYHTDSKHFVRIGESCAASQHVASNILNL